MSRRVLVFGPAYLDRVLLVDRPLLDPARGGPLDRSVEARVESGEGPGLSLRDPIGGTLEIDPPTDWPGPLGSLRLLSPLDPGAGRPWVRRLTALGWHDDLGGMGAGFASALDGTLVSALGPESDPTSRAISDRLAGESIPHLPIRVPDRPADWTLLLTSGPHGDKLPVGFRGCHASLASLPDARATLPRPDLVVVAGLSNRLASQALRARPGTIRMLAPAMRNMTDRDPPLGDLAGLVDILCGNREEWSALPEPDRARLLGTLSLQALTDGPRGALVRFRDPRGSWSELSVPAFPRSSPPRDTNRAGEAFASTLVSSLLDSGWHPGPADPAPVRSAALRASAAAALELGLVRFGFPSPSEIDLALSTPNGPPQGEPPPE